MTTPPSNDFRIVSADPGALGSGDLRTAEDWLTASERARAGRYARSEDRQLFVTARWLARRELAEATATPPTEWDFEFEEHGKPIPIHAGGARAPAINWSHTSGLAVCALGSTDLVGVDVERLDREAPFERLARRFFHPEEQRLLAASTELAATFWRIWTLKEAVLKAWGSGFTTPPATFAVRTGATPELLTHEGLRLEGRSLPSGHVLGLAVGEPATS